MPAVDHEHETLIRLINELYVIAREGGRDEDVIEFLGEIHARISAHFALEEKVMRDHGYDQYPEHKRDHEKLLDGIRDIMDEFEAGGYGAQYEEKLGDHLRSWFTDHFRTHDARLHHHFGIEAL